MYANYHSHTYRCGHAVGTEREYVEAAVAAGLRTLGISDHSPQPVPEDFDDSGVRMNLRDLEDYAGTVMRLKEEYKDRIDIRLGVELEYFPDYFEYISRRLKDAGVEYMIQGQHYLGRRAGEPYIGRICVRDDLKRYVDQTIEGMSTGRYFYLAHPDLPNYGETDDNYLFEMSRLCEAAKKLDVPLEINLLGIRSCRHYPREAFWELAGRIGCRTVIGCDSHKPCDVTDPGSEKKALEMAERCGLTVETELELR